MFVCANKDGEKGHIFILALLMIVLCSGLLTAGYLTAIGDVDRTKVETKRVLAYACAESGIDVAAKQLRSFVSQYQTALPTGTITVNDVDVTWSVEKAYDSVGNELVLTSVDADGFRTICHLYIIRSSCTYDGRFASVCKYLSLDEMPIFQFFAFSNRDLELFPDQDMKVDGRVYTSADLFLGADISATMSFKRGNVRVVGDVWRHKKDDPTYYSTGNVTFPNGDTFPNEYDSDWEGVYDGMEMDFAQMAVERWDGFLLTGVHGIDEIEAPEMPSIQPFVYNDDGTGDYTYSLATGAYAYTPGTGDYDQGFFYSEAGLHIVDGKVYIDGVDVTASLPAGTISEGYFYDAREGLYVKTTDVDVAAMAGTIVTVNGVVRKVWPSNGLIYAYRKDSTVATPNGIRLHSASTLPSAVTWVSSNPVYIWGDYNSSTTSKSPSSVICDAINFLSKSWDDSKVPGKLPKKPSSTAFNLGIIAGNTESFVGVYNGGVENFPRFHEDWNGVKVHMETSFISLWDSVIGDGEWHIDGDYYTECKRDWYFEEDYLDPTKLPPYTPSAYSLRTVAWWKNEVLPWD